MDAMDASDPGMGSQSKVNEAVPGGVPAKPPGLSRRRWMWIGLIILVLVVILREAGTLDFNLYRSEMSTGHAASVVTRNDPASKVAGYDLSVKSGNKVLRNIRFGRGGQPRMAIVAEMNAPEYQGNTWLPFYKKFSMKYVCSFKTVSAPPECKVEGKLDGNVDIRIVGLCSRNKARGLARDEAVKSIEKYLKKNLKVR